MKPFDKLIQRVKEDIGLTLLNPRRTYFGTNQRSAGAFSWVAECSENIHVYGSEYTVKELIESEEKLVLDRYDHCKIRPKYNPN